MDSVNSVILYFVLTVGFCGGKDISELYHELFDNYTVQVLPKCNSNEAVQVTIGLALRQIIDLNEPRQVIETDTWVRLAWKDCQLSWNKTETGINNMVVPFESIWVPDITLYDNAQNALGGLENFRPNVNSEGIVSYNFPSVIKSLCKVDVTYFPFDTQICKMKFGSWSYHGWDLNVSGSFTQGDISMYVSNGEWSIVALPAIRHELYYLCCDEPYPDVTFYVIIRRKPLFYLMNLIFPCTIISTMAFLGFLLPPDSGEKVSLEITVLLSLAVFLLVVSETMPPDSETFPFIGVYFACAMLLVSLSCLMTVIVLNLHFKGEFGKKLPNWARKIFLHCLGRLLHVKVEQHAMKEKLHQKPAHEAYDNRGFPVYMTNEEGADFDTITDNENNIHNMMNHLDVNHVSKTEFKDLKLDTETNEVLNLLTKQLDCLEMLHGYFGDKLRLEYTMEDWKKLAQVVDRIFMVLFFIFQFSTTLAILVRISTANPDIEYE